MNGCIFETIYRILQEFGAVVGHGGKRGGHVRPNPDALAYIYLLSPLINGNALAVKRL